MKIDFRQGIVTYPQVANTGQAFLQVIGSGSIDVNLNTGSGQTTVAFAQRTADYLHIETSPVTNAWTGIDDTPGVSSWLYWDIDTKTGIRTFGSTIVTPVSQNTQPGTLTTDLHWFDTVNNVMKVYDGTRFIERIRVFAARIEGTTLFPMGTNASKPFAGTQAGINRTTFAGQILFAEGTPVIISIPGTFSPTATNPFARNFVFATTETAFLTGGSQKVNSIRLESDVVTATAGQNIAAYDIVKWTGFGKIAPAGYNDTGTTTLGMVVDSHAINEIATVVVQGVIANASWNWTTVGAELFVLANGNLTQSDPNITTPSLYPVSKPPVARVLSRTEIIFMQGLGKVGPRGANPLSINTIGDVTISNAIEGEVLRYSGSPLLWRNDRVELDDLEDVVLGSPLVDEDFLQYDTTASNWANVTRRDGNIGYFSVTPIARNTSQAFVTTDAGNAIISSTVGSPIPSGIEWTLNPGVFEVGDVITLIRRLNASSVTITPGTGVEIISSTDGTSTLVSGSPFIGSPQATILTLDNPAKTTLFFIEIGSPGVDTWLIDGTGVTFT